MKVKKQHLRVFLEGMEFKYVNSLTITEGEGAPPSFEITTNYIKRLQNILPKTLCHVFYLHNDEYIFILEGELTGISFVKNALQKIAKLQFTGTTLNWRNHYILAKDTDLRYFDRGAFLVLNAELPLTYDDTYVSEQDSSSPDFVGPVAPSLDTTNRYVANQGKYNAIAAYNESNWNEFFKKITSPINYPELVALAVPKFPLDIYFALGAQEGAQDTVFSKNVESARESHISIEYYKTSLELKNNENIKIEDLYSYVDQTGSEASRGYKTLYGRTGWGLLQVMGFEMLASSDFTQREIDRLINGIEYKQYCKSQGTTPNFKNPQISKEYNIYFDSKSKKYFEIPSLEYLIVLQAKSAFELFKRKVATLGASRDLETGSLTNKVHPKSIFKSWMGWNSTGEAYANQIYKYYLKAIQSLKTGEYATDKAAVASDSAGQAYPNIAQDPDFQGIDANANLYRTSYDDQPWIRSLVEGGQIVTSVDNIFGKYAADNDLETLIKGILDALAITSSYYKTLHESLRLGIEKIFIVDSEPARRLFKINAIAKFIMMQASNTQMGSILSGLDLIKIITNNLGYNIIELATPIKDVSSVVITPDTTFMTPIKNNIFLSDQINDFQFMRNMEGEPTRYTSFTNQMGLLHSQNSRDPIDLTAAYVTPRIPNMSDSSYILDGTAKLRQYTFEESYRGVHAQQGTMSSTPFEEILFDMFEKTTIEDSNNLESTVSGFLNPYWKSIVDGVFLKQRYGTRTAILTTSYHPERICGFPACVIDTELPTTIGKISSIVSTISADGNATSQVTLMYCHTHWDDDLDTQDFKNTYNYSNDAVPAMDHIWKYLTDDPEKKYRWYNLGKQIYSPMLGKETSEDSSVLAFSEKSYLIEDEIPTQDWANYNKALGNAFKNIRKIYGSYTNKYKFSDAIINRDFLTMEQYWLQLTGEKIPQPSNYRDGKSLLIYQENILSGQKLSNQSYNYKPFLAERQVKVKEILNYLMG